MLQDLGMLRWNRASKFQNPALEFITENLKIYMVLSFLDVAFSSRYLLAYILYVLCRILDMFYLPYCIVMPAPNRRGIKQ